MQTRYIRSINPTTGVSQWLTEGLRGYRLRERSEAQLPGCLGEAPTADAVGISKEAGRRVPLAYPIGWIWPQSVTFLTAFVLVSKVERTTTCGYFESSSDAGRGYDRTVAQGAQKSHDLCKASVFDAIMKSLRCRPPILWVHHVTVTLPHSVKRAG
jgi:hypothetical protein